MQNCTQYSRCGLMSTEWREIITSLELLAVFLLIQLRMQLVAFAARADVLCCCVMLGLLTPRTTRVFSTELCPSQGHATLFWLFLFHPPLPLLLTWSQSLKVPAVLQMDGTKGVSSQKGWDSLGLQMSQDELQPLCNGCSRNMCVVCVRSINKVSPFPL